MSEDTEASSPGAMRRRLRREIIGTLREARDNSARRIERLLDERTRLLAARGTKLLGSRADEENMLLVCRIGGERVGLPLSGVEAVLPNQPVSPIPSRYPEMLGIIAAGAEIYNVIDLARILGLTPVNPRDQDESMLVLLRRRSPRIALLVDFAEEATQIAREADVSDGASGIKGRGIIGYIAASSDSAEQGIALLELDTLLQPLLSSTSPGGAA